MVLYYCSKEITGKEKKGMDNELSIFKSYLRRLKRDLEDLKEIIKNEDYKKAEEKIEHLIEDTQKGIED